ncbi:MAG: hypothetical protein R6W77_06220 [Trueperaceae bacterium]
MIRNLAPDEVVWFIGRALAFLGHPEPHAMSMRLGNRLRDAVQDARHCFVLERDAAAPSAGMHVVAPEPADDVRTMVITSPWHDDDPDGFVELLDTVLRKNAHEAVLVRLHSMSSARRDDLTRLIEPFGFVPDELRRLRFELSDVPPIGAPLVLEAWQPDADAAFRSLFQRAEGRMLGDAGWAFLKRRHGPFRPDLWYLARETLDQDPVGYAFCGTRARGVDASYALDAVGVLQEHRSDSEMLRRLLVSTLQELSSMSPMGVVDTELGQGDPKLIDILASLGFVEVERMPALLRMPR